jgi:hypothetical protein
MALDSSSVQSSATPLEKLSATVRRTRYALLCALSIPLCLLCAWPLVSTGIIDDGPYIRMVQVLANTGRVTYTGWGAPMIGWQLYLGAALVKLLGFSFTVVRLSTVLIAMANAFVFERALLRCGLRERSAVLGTLALVLSPVFLMLSMTLMTDVGSVFAVTLCFYSCLRVLQAADDRAAIGWLVCAVATNAIFGTVRQIAWLGVLVMVPSTLWLLRRRRRVVVVGAVATLLGAAFIFGCIHWLNQQPYSVPEHLFTHEFEPKAAATQLYNVFADLPFLLLSLCVLFVPYALRGRVWAVTLRLALALAIPCILPHYGLHGIVSLIPPSGSNGSMVSVFAGTSWAWLHGSAPVAISESAQMVITGLALLSLFGMLQLAHSPQTSRQPASSESMPTRTAFVPWQQLRVLIVPYCAAYCLLLLPRASRGLFDRYMMGLMPFLVLAMLGLYQTRAPRPHWKLAFLFVALGAMYGVVRVHNYTVMLRARLALMDELQRAGVPDNAVDAGWDMNFVTELRYAPSLNWPEIVHPAGFYKSFPTIFTLCPVYRNDVTPHIHPQYALSYSPNTCYGPSHFAPANFQRWLSFRQETIYVVRATPNAP